MQPAPTPRASRNGAPPRRTRREMQQDTRARLIEAALHTVAEGGVGAASIRGVSERAGFSQGAFYSNFASKDDLLLALVEEHMASIAQSLVDLVETTRDMTLDASLHQLSERLERLAENPILSLLIIELHLHAQRDPGFARRFDQVKADYHAEFTEITEALIARHRLIPLLPPREIAVTMLSLWSGAIVQNTTGGAVAIEKIIMLFFKAATAPDPMPIPAP